MKINEVTHRLKSFVATVRCVVPKSGTFTTKIGIQSDSLTNARHVLSRQFGAQNILSVTRNDWSLISPWSSLPIYSLFFENRYCWCLYSSSVETIPLRKTIFWSQLNLRISKSNKKITPHKIQVTVTLIVLIKLSIDWTWDEISITLLTLTSSFVTSW